MLRYGMYFAHFRAKPCYEKTAIYFSHLFIIVILYKGGIDLQNSPFFHVLVYLCKRIFMVVASA